ncbi:hypothetical protein YC2023_085591 [Brassica napus]
MHKKPTTLGKRQKQLSAQHKPNQTKVHQRSKYIPHQREKDGNTSPPRVQARESKRPQTPLPSPNWKTSLDKHGNHRNLTGNNFTTTYSTRLKPNHLHHLIPYHRRASIEPIRDLIQILQSTIPHPKNQSFPPNGKPEKINYSRILATQIRRKPTVRRRIRRPGRRRQKPDDHQGCDAGGRAGWITPNQRETLEQKIRPMSWLRKPTDAGQIAPESSRREERGESVFLIRKCLQSETRVCPTAFRKVWIRLITSGLKSKVVE